MEREQTTLRLPVALLEQLRREAQEQGMSFNSLVIDLIRKGRLWESGRDLPRTSQCKHSERVQSVDL